MTNRSFVWIAVFALVAGCGGGGGGSSSPTTPSPGGASATVNIDGDAYRPGGAAAFAPGSVTVKTGTTVTWRNNDQTDHTVTQDNGSFNSGGVGGGGSYSRQFNTTGSFEYHCTIHPSMTGVVVVQQ